VADITEATAGRGSLPKELIRRAPVVGPGLSRALFPKKRVGGLRLDKLE